MNTNVSFFPSVVIPESRSDIRDLLYFPFGGEWHWVPAIAIPGLFVQYLVLLFTGPWAGDGQATVRDVGIDAIFARRHLGYLSVHSVFA